MYRVPAIVTPPLVRSDSFSKPATIFATSSFDICEQWHRYMNTLFLNVILSKMSKGNDRSIIYYLRNMVAPGAVVRNASIKAHDNQNDFTLSDIKERKYLTFRCEPPLCTGKNYKMKYNTNYPQRFFDVSRNLNLSPIPPYLCYACKNHYVIFDFWCHFDSYFDTQVL